MIKKTADKRYIAAAMAVFIALQSQAAAFTAYAGSDTDTVAVYLGGELQEDPAAISTEQGETIYAYKDEASEDADYEPADGNIISDEELNDTVIEYDELGTFIHKYNTTVQNARLSVNSQKQQYQQLKEELASELGDALKSASDAEDEGDSESYNTYKSYQETYKSAIKSYNSMIDTLNSRSSLNSVKTTEKTLTSAAQSLMISYNTVKLSRESADKLTELYEERYKNTQLMAAAGSAASAEVEAAKNTLDSVKISQESLKTSEEEIYKNLCILLGVDENAGYTIGELPEPDTAYIAERDLAADIETAINNSSSVTSIRHQASSGSAEASNKDASLSLAEDEVRISMTGLYNSMTEADTSYQSAKLSYTNTEEAWKLAGSKYSMGMLSKAEYLEEEAAYLSGKSELETARINLLTAINTYQWALKGIT